MYFLHIQSSICRLVKYTETTAISNPTNVDLLFKEFTLNESSSKFSTKLHRKLYYILVYVYCWKSTTIKH